VMVTARHTRIVIHAHGTVECVPHIVVMGTAITMLKRLVTGVRRIVGVVRGTAGMVSATMR